MTDIQQSIANEMALRAERSPEAISVFVTTTDRPMAEAAAPLVAARLYTDRRFGQVLHAELASAFGIDGHFVAVEDLGSITDQVVLGHKETRR